MKINASLQPLIQKCLQVVCEGNNNKTCSLCGKWGHLRKDCFLLPENKEKLDKYRAKQRQRFTDVQERVRSEGRGRLPYTGRQRCYLCGVEGHIARNCLMSYQSRRNTEDGNVGVDEEEIAFSCQEIRTEKKKKSSNNSRDNNGKKNAGMNIFVATSPGERGNRKNNLGGNRKK